MDRDRRDVTLATLRNCSQVLSLSMALTAGQTQTALVTSGPGGGLATSSVASFGSSGSAVADASDIEGVENCRIAMSCDVFPLLQSLMTGNKDDEALMVSRPRFVP